MVGGSSPPLGELLNERSFFKKNDRLLFLMVYISDLFGKYAELNVLRFLLLDGDSFHLKEISRRAKTSPSTVSKLLLGLEKDCLVERKVIGTSHVFKVKSENPVVKQLKVLLAVSLLFENKLIEKILEIDAHAHSIVLYGSFASGLNDAKSDLDLLVVSDEKKNFDSVARQLEKKSGFPVSIEVFSVLDWKKCREKNRVFYDNVKSNHILLHGSELF